MKTPVVILGGGGHARVVLDTLRRLDIEVAGLVAPEPPRGAAPVPYLGDDDALRAFDPGSVRLVNGLGSIGRTRRRQELFSRFKSAGFGFATLVDPTALVSPSAELGEGVQILATAVVQAGARIAANSIVNTGAIVEHDCLVGEHCHIAPRAVLSGGIEVGNGSHIGVGATIIQGIVLGDEVVVAAGAVVIRDVGPGATVAGVPARTISR